MNKLYTIVPTVLLILFLLIWSYRCGRDKYECPPEGMILISQSEVDSANALVEMYKDSIRIDTVVVKVERIVYRYVSFPVETKPVAQENDTIIFYNDSLILDSYSVWTTDYIADNSILRRDWRYTLPEPVTIVKTVIKPVIQTVYKDKFVQKTMIIGKAGVGYGTTDLGNSIGLQVVNKKKISYGASYHRYHDNWFIEVDLGLVLVSW